MSNNVEISKNSSGIILSKETDNGLHTKEDGLFLESIKDRIDTIKDRILDKKYGNFIIGDFSYTRSPAVKCDDTIVIPIDLAFMPKKVLVGFDYIKCTYSTSELAISNLFIGSDKIVDIHYDSNVNSTTSYTCRGVKIRVTYDKNDAYVHIIGFRDTANNYYDGVDETTVKIHYKISKWIAFRE